MRPYFSVIVPTFNRARFVVATIESVFAQTYRDFELIIIDDGSSDETPGILKGYSDHAKIVSQPNRGPGSARNHGAQLARASHIVFVDSDDVWFPWTLETYRKITEEAPDVVLILGAPVHFSCSQSLAQVKQDSLSYVVYNDYLATSRTNLFRGSGVMAIQANMFRELGGFAESRAYSEDLDFLMRCGECGPLAAISSPLTLGRRTHGLSSVGNMQLTYQGMKRLLELEQQKQYPGGSTRKWERRRLLCLQARAVSNWCLKAKMRSEAFDVYFRTFQWQLRLGYLLHLVKIPTLALFPWLRVVRQIMRRL